MNCRNMDADEEFEMIYECIDGFGKCNGIQYVDSSTINFTPVIRGENVDLKKLNVYEVDILEKGYMISDEMNYEDFSAIAYLFWYKNGLYYIDCKHVQCDKHEFGPHEYTRFRPILSTAFTVRCFYDNISNMYKYGYGPKADKTSTYAMFSHDITKYTSEYHSYERCFNRRGWTYMKKIHKYLCYDDPCDYIDHRYEEEQNRCNNNYSDSDSD